MCCQLTEVSPPCEFDHQRLVLGRLIWSEEISVPQLSGYIQLVPPRVQRAPHSYPSCDWTGSKMNPRSAWLTLAL